MTIVSVFSKKKIPRKNSYVSEEGKRGGSFFGKIFARKQREMKKSTEKISKEPLFSRLSGSSCFESRDGSFPSYSYEAIITGQAPLNQLDLEKVEVKTDKQLNILIITNFMSRNISNGKIVLNG